MYITYISNGELLADFILYLLICKFLTFVKRLKNAPAEIF